MLMTVACNLPEDRPTDRSVQKFTNLMNYGLHAVFSPFWEFFLSLLAR